MNQHFLRMRGDTPHLSLWILRTTNIDIVLEGWRKDDRKDIGYRPLIQRKASSSCKKNAKEIRYILINYFNSAAGAVFWQTEYVNK